MKFNNIKKIFYLLVVTLLTFTSCNDVDFGDTNTDPNNPSVLSAKSLLSGAERDLPMLIDATTPMTYVQYLTNGQYNGESQYSGLNWPYDFFYNRALLNLNTVIKLNTDDNTKGAAAAEGGYNNNQIAVAKILRTFYFQIMTNRWGMIPYNDALQGLGNEGNIYPKFDTQEDIYRALFVDLNDALSRINEGESGPTGDFVLNGNMTHWKQFGTSLKAVMALRLSRRNADLNDLPKNMFVEAYNSGNLITSYTGNVYYPYTTGDLNDNPWDDRFDTRKDYLIADTFMNVLNNGTNGDFSDDDPRLEKYAATTESDPNVFVGAPYGEVNSATDDYSFMNYDIIGYNGGKNDFPGVILTSAQIHFSIAEAIELGWVTGTAEDFFKSGISESMKQWEVEQSKIDAYVGAATYTGVKDIAMEKWIAMYMQGYESWSEWRRFNASGDAPALNTDFAHLNGTGIISRQAYSANAAATNKENYDAAVVTQGVDDLDTVLWIFQ